MPAAFDYDLCQCDRPVEHSSRVCPCLLFVPHIDASPGPESVRTTSKLCLYVDTAGNNVVVPINCLGECLPPFSIFQYNDRDRSSFDASHFRHGMRLSRHLFDICADGQVCLTCAGGWQERWFH